MSDDLPGWTCPDIDMAIRRVRRLGRQALATGPIAHEDIREDVQTAVAALERIRGANHQLRRRCSQLLVGQLGEPDYYVVRNEVTGHLERTQVKRTLEEARTWTQLYTRWAIVPCWDVVGEPVEWGP